MSASTKDLLPTQRGWIHDLARAELYPAAHDVLQIAEGQDPTQILEESSAQFLGDLREQLSEYSKVFNSYSEAASRFQEIKVYGLAQSPSDFMLYRNQVKLLFTNPNPGVIQVAFAKHVRGSLAIDGVVHAEAAQAQDYGRPQELLAQLGPFRDVRWTFQAEPIAPEQVARFYFGEFVKASRDGRRGKAGNQVLLEQIKALLQEKGLEL